MAIDNTPAPWIFRLDQSYAFRRWLASELASVTDLLSIEIDNTYEKPIALACFPFNYTSRTPSTYKRRIGRRIGLCAFWTRPSFPPTIHLAQIFPERMGTRLSSPRWLFPWPSHCYLLVLALWLYHCNWLGQFPHGRIPTLTVLPTSFAYWAWAGKLRGQSPSPVIPPHFL